MTSLPNSAPGRVISLRPARLSYAVSGVVVGDPDGRAPSPASSASPTRRREPLWRNVIGDVLRRERLTQERTLKEVSEAARISMPYLSEVERGLKEASSEVLAAAAGALGMRLIDLLERAHRELAREAAQTEVARGQRRPTPITTARALSSGGPAPSDDDPYAVTQVTSVVEVSSRHTDLTGDSAPATISGLSSGSVTLAA